MKFISKIQDEASKEENRKMAHENKLREQLQRARINNSLEKARNKAIRSLMREGLLEENHKTFGSIKEKQKVNEKHIAMMKEKDKQGKIDQRMMVNEMEKRQKQNIERYFRKKKEAFLKDSEREKQYFDERRG